MTEDEDSLNSFDLKERDKRALDIVRDGDILLYNKGGARVSSQTNGDTYAVTDDFCECADYQFNGKICKHIRAFRIVKLMKEARDRKFRKQNRKMEE